MNWRLGKKIEPTQLPDLPLNFIHSATAVEEIENFMKAGIELKATVKGYRTNTGETAFLRGTVRNYKGDWETGIFAIYLQTERWRRGVRGRIWRDL